MQHRSTRLTLATRELETEVRVDRQGRRGRGRRRPHPAAPRDGQALPPWEPGAHVDLILGSAATRQYSLCGDPADRHTWRLGILRDPNGSGGSLYVHDQLRAGDTVRIRGPRNNFPLVDSPRYLFIAGGIGITPILAMIRSAEAAGAEWRLVYGGRHRASMAFLDELAAYGDRVTVWPQDEKGFIDLDGLLGAPQPDTKVYCCGPEPLLNAVEQNCAAWPEGALHVERFVAKPLTEPVLHEAFEVHLAQSGLTLTVPPEKSILDAVEEAGIGVLSSCRKAPAAPARPPSSTASPTTATPCSTQHARRSQRLHDDLRLPRLHPPPGPRPLMSESDDVLLLLGIGDFHEREDRSGMIAWARYPYEGTTVLVTGGGSGIGRAIARGFLEQGASVLVTGRHAEPLHDTIASFPDDRAAVVVGDMATQDGVTAAVDDLVERWGHLDVVVANAGLSTPGTVDTLDDASWERMRSINLDGLIRLARTSVPRLRESRGSFLAISSIAGFGGDWNQAGYNATKGAVNALVQSMALDLGRDGVRVNAIAPAFTATRQTQERLDDPAFWSALRDRLALDRAAQPEDVARAALFLASPDAAYITGVVLPVDGGTTASVGTPRPITGGSAGRLGT